MPISEVVLFVSVQYTPWIVSPFHYSSREIYLILPCYMALTNNTSAWMMWSTCSEIEKQGCCSWGLCSSHRAAYLPVVLVWAWSRPRQLTRSVFCWFGSSRRQRRHEVYLNHISASSQGHAWKTLRRGPSQTQEEASRYSVNKKNKRNTKRETLYTNCWEASILPQCKV